MKTVLTFMLFFLFSSGLYAQTVIRKGIHQDTIIKTKQLRQTTSFTPRGSAIQIKDVGPRQGKWYFKGAFGMAFGDQTTINIVPQVSYSQNPYFDVGGGINYVYYYSSKKHITEKMNYAGINLFARINPFPYLTFQFQPELMSRWGKHNDDQVSGRLVPTFLAGGGFTLPVGPGSINLLFLFDIIQNDYTPYGKNLYYNLGYAIRFK